MKNKFAFISLGLIPLLLTGCGATMSVYPDADKYLVGNQTYEENITSLDVDWISGTITLVEDENIEGVKIEETINTSDQNCFVHSYLNNGELKVKYFKSGYVSHEFNLKKELTITYKPGLDKIRIDLTSGILKAETVTAAKFELDMTSGNTKINTLTADDVDTEATSGTIEITKVNAKTLDADMTSGTYNVGFDKIEKASFDMTSGTINMTLPEDGGTVKVSKTSGTVTTDRECKISENTYTFGSGSADVKVSMTSGKLRIK